MLTAHIALRAIAFLFKFKFLFLFGVVAKAIVVMIQIFSKQTDNFMSVSLANKFPSYQNIYKKEEFA